MSCFSARLRRALLIAACVLPLGAQTRLLRFPDIHGEKLVFTYGGDLWTAPSGGGTAIRLTAHPGLELFAKFSPDGKWLAFTGQYDGDEQVYVMPSTGGVPRQLTYYPARGPLAPRWGYDNQVYGWTNDGKRVIFRSLRDSWTNPISRLYTVSMEGGPAEALPMPESGAASFSPGGNKLVYSPRARDFRSEKRYSGGQANSLYIFDVETHEARKITDSLRASRDPMWIGDAIFFNSDRDGHFNLFAYETQSGKTTQLTFNKLWDVRWPSTDRKARIVYELNGELQIFDVKTRKSAPVAITVPDDGVARRPSRVAAASLIEGASLSPKGERVLFAARGDVFSAPVEKGPTRNLSRTPGAHEKHPVWSPDGATVAFISDASGEEEIWIAAQDGSKPPEQITKGGQAMRYAPAWAPDGKRLAFGDKDGRVWVLTLSDRSLVEVAKARRGAVGDYVWSPAGNHLAFSMPNANEFSSLYIWSAGDGQLRRITGESFNAYNPAWDPQGNYLWYTAVHEFSPLISSAEFNYATNRMEGLYALALRKNVKHPFPPESDEVAVAKGEPEKPAAEKEPSKPPAEKEARHAPAEKEAPKPPAEGGPPKPPAEGTPNLLAEGTPNLLAEKEATKPLPEKEPSKPPADLKIDFDGLEQRVARVPLEPNNYSNLRAAKDGLVYMVQGSPYYGRPADPPPSVRLFTFKDRKETTLLDKCDGFSLSRDGSKLLARQEQAWYVFDATAAGPATKKGVSTAGLMVDRVPAEEWRQIYGEVWRRYRDFFYAPNMHGYDWAKLRDQYRPWLEHVAHRSDLNFVIGEMISELTVQHAYIDGGDMQLPARPKVALPGARFELDRDTGRFRISKIFEGQNEEEIYRSPLTEIGLDVKVGDYVLAINGAELKGSDDPYRLLRNAADSPVQLTVNSKPVMEGARTVSFKPITDESNLIYLDWVNANRRKVSELSGGRIGYLHVPDMGANGIREFIKWYYPQLRKDALIVDVRANGGGNVSRMLIERLRRKMLATWFSRRSEEADPYPDGVFIGPMAAILNENSASDGDIFPAMFRQAGLGPLIGKRSWGGVVGISDHGQLMDGGRVNVPEYAFASAKGEWWIEGHGVDPDIEVENDPKSVIAGRDPQLERAVAEVMAKLKQGAPVLPKRPLDPVKLK